MSDSKEGQYTYSRGSSTLKKSRSSYNQPASVQKPSNTRQKLQEPQKPQTPPPEDTSGPKDDDSQSAPPDNQGNTDNKKPKKRLLDVDLDLGPIDIGLKL